jgi:hypothetical protein
VATEALCACEKLASPCWEPAAGDGAISKVLRSRGIEVVESDIVTGTDFLRHPPPSRFIDIVTNPPYRIANKFVLTSIGHIAQTGGKACLLLRLAFLEGLRGGLFQVHPPTRVHVFSRRLPRMHRVGWEGNKSSSMIAFAWFVWDYCPTIRRPPTQIDWVDWKDFAQQGG